MRSSKLIIESIAQKVMAKFGFGHRFHGLGGGTCSNAIFEWIGKLHTMVDHKPSMPTKTKGYHEAPHI